MMSCSNLHAPTLAVVLPDTGVVFGMRPHACQDAVNMADDALCIVTTTMQMAVHKQVRPMTVCC